MANPAEWAHPEGALLFYAVLTAILTGCILKLLGARWDDWLDERWGRGSIRDRWPWTEHDGDVTGHHSAEH